MENPKSSKFSLKASKLVDHEALASGPPPQSLLTFFKWGFSGTGWVIALTAFAIVCASGLEVASYYLLGEIVALVDFASPTSLWDDHAGLFISFVLISIVLRPIAFGSGSLLNSLVLGPGLFNLALGRINRHVLGQAISYFDDDFAGRIAQKEMQTARAMTDVVMETIQALVFAVTMAIGTAALFGSISTQLLFLLAGWFFLYVGFLIYFLPRMRSRSKNRAAARAMVTGQIVDTVTNMRLVKLFAAGKREDRAAARAMSEFRSTSVHWAEMAVLFRIGLVFLGGLLPVLMLGMGLLMWQRGLAGTGELAAIGALSLRLGQMTGWVSWTMLGIFSNLGEIEDGIRTLAPAHDLVDREDARDLKISTPDIRFQDVEFQYGLNQGGVKDVTLHVQAGEKLGLVGASGAGKSTLLSLAQRLFDPENGCIEISGQKISELKQDSLRSQISMVTQDAAMFNRSARDNILYGRPDASEEAMILAARQAEAHEFIVELEDRRGRRSYDAFLGERGVKLSGGQRQRIALARALLKDADILLLDEATSALDSEVEAQIQAALARVMEGKTVIAVAHRLSTIARMDRIVVMDNGRIVEQGTHEALLAQKGIYAKLWSHQSGGFLKTEKLARL